MGMFTENSDVTQQEVMELLLMNQYFDTLKEMTLNKRTTTVFVPSSGGNEGQLRDALLQASSHPKSV
eukprot:NODE_10558_length_283_cov_5.662393_g8790_i0.p2 GENE.NODE_10558_length_283_cov_5.662393_g8790_i0~~NODE_10558_length_283_cov_5.662393_g8790_i0.p2  ORF type:complete len:75 (-),score=38.09 NODE_10558_length_283_cov_5.662393_g8790_i0:57-257(-)